MHDVAEAALILDQLDQPIEIAARARLDPRLPQLHNLARRGWRRRPGQSLPHDHRQRVLDRRVGAIGDLVIAAAVKAVVQHRVEVAGDPEHPAGADRLYSRLLDRFERRARLLAVGEQLAVDGPVVTGHA